MLERVGVRVLQRQGGKWAKKIRWPEGTPEIEFIQSEDGGKSLSYDSHEVEDCVDCPARCADQSNDEKLDTQFDRFTRHHS